MENMIDVMDFDHTRHEGDLNWNVELKCLKSKIV